MIRIASKRTASMDLTWYDSGDDSAAILPWIPDYTYPSSTDRVANVYGESDGTWWFDITIGYMDDDISLNAGDFNLQPSYDSREEAEAAVESLSPEDIANRLAELGYEPLDDIDEVESIAASRKGKHMIRRSDEKTDTRIVENEDGTYTAYCEGDKKIFDDKGKAAEWLADHFNDEYHDKADARRAARRRLMMRAAVRRAAMRKAADDDDRKDKGFDVSYDKDGKIHVHFDDGSDMDFDDMHDFADYVEGPDADEKPVDKEEAAHARHAARVAMMRRRAARVASRPVARHAMRQDDGHPYL